MTVGQLGAEVQEMVSFLLQINLVTRELLPCDTVIFLIDSLLISRARRRKRNTDVRVHHPSAASHMPPTRVGAMGNQACNPLVHQMVPNQLS